MKLPVRGLSLVEVIALILIAALLFLWFVPIFGHRATPESRRRACSNNLAQIGKACIFYSESYGDFFPVQSQYEKGTEDRFLPMPSLAILYPVYIDNWRVFGCPSTKDKPFISVLEEDEHRWACFGTDREGEPATNPVQYSGKELATELKCSYFYDERSHFREVGPDRAMACDADGQTWLDPDGEMPAYPDNWTRIPRKPNHANGQNVLCFDGHVKWWETAYCSDDPSDNIFTSGGIAPDATAVREPDVDAYLWDGVNARTE